LYKEEEENREKKVPLPESGGGRSGGKGNLK
jgi:hypothetical protein